MPGLPWKRVAKIEFWLCVFPPVGFRMLYQEPSLPRSTKIRMVIYTYLIPLLVYFALSLYLFNTAQRAMEAAGGGM